MLWFTEPLLAVELACWSVLITACKVGPWLVWPVMQVVLNRRSRS